MIIIRNLEDLPLSTLYEAFNDAFAGYMTSWTQEEFIAMLSRRGFDPTVSFGAFDGDRLVSFTFNGIGTFSGCATAYDTGTGTIASHRGQGLAGRIFSESIAPLQQEGISQYLLEVLHDNETAIALYTKQGFAITRTLHVFRTKMTDLNKQLLHSDPLVQLKKIDFSKAQSLQALWEIQPSWQNTFDAILRQHEKFICMGAFLDDKLVGYGIIEPASGDIPQLFVHTQFRRRKVGSRIFQSLCALNKAEIIKVVNTDAAYDTITEFLEWNGLPRVTSQFEMLKML